MYRHTKLLKTNTTKPETTNDMKNTICPFCNILIILQAITESKNKIDQL